MTTKYIHFTEDELNRANAVNLELFLAAKGEKLQRAGKDKRLESDHSITVRGNVWYDHSKEVGGYPIEFMKMFYGLDFPMAVKELLGTPGFLVSHKAQERPKPFALPPRNRTMNHVHHYLTKHRGIDPSVLSVFANKGIVYESHEFCAFNRNEYHNAVFVGLDENSQPSHAQKRGLNIRGKRFVQNVEGSKPEHSFHFLGGSEKLFVFESPIDLLSYVTMHKNSGWQTHNHLALCGISSKALVAQLENNLHICHVFLCLDNDEAGHRACEKFTAMLKERRVTHERFVPKGKDFNEELLSYNQKYAMKIL